MLKNILLFSVCIVMMPFVKAQTYCAAGPTSTALAEIVSVSIIGSSYSIYRVSTACGATGVQDFTNSDSANVTQGGSFTLKVAFGTCSGGAISSAGQVWIDWNQNGIFEATESVGTRSGNSNIFGTTIPNFTVTINVPVSPFIGRTRMRVMQQAGGTIPLDPCSTFNTGSVEDYTINVVGASPCANPPISGVTVISPWLVCPAQPFTLSLNSLTFGNGQTYQWQYSTDSILWTNLVNQTQPSITSLAPTTRWFRCQITCGGTTVPSSAEKVTVINNPLPAGTYTINGSTPTGANNFNSFADFAQYANCGGIAGPIVVNIIAKGSSYNEQVAFDDIPGSSAINTITINGNGQTISYTGGDPQYATMLFDGTQHVKVKNLIISGTGTTKCFGIQLLGNAQHVEFDSCTINVPRLTVNFPVAVFVASGLINSITTPGLIAQNITVKNSILSGGLYGISLIGPSAAPYASNNIVQNNVIQDFLNYGIYATGQHNTFIKGNDINRAQITGQTGPFYGISLLGNMTGVHVIGNKIHKPNGQNISGQFTVYALHFTNANASAINPLLVTNNAIYDLNSLGTNYGVYLASGDFINFYHNTFNLKTSISVPSSIQRLFYSSATSGTFQIKNNIFQMVHAGLSSKYLLYFTSTLPNFSIDYNQYYLDETDGYQNYFARYPTNVADFAAWQALNGGAFDAHGVYGDAVFNTTNYTPESPIGDNKGTNLLSFVPTDLNDSVRTSTPDIGAVEFYLPTCFEPTLIVSLAAVNSIALNWLNDVGADSVRIEYGLSGFVQGNGTFINIADSSHTITGLTSQTCYDFYFRTWCGDTLGLSHALYTACTECGSKQIPFTEKFDSIVASNIQAIPGLPPCWNYYKSPTHTGYVFTASYDSPKSLPNHVRFGNGLTLNDTILIVSPALQGLTANDKQVSFWAKSSGLYSQSVIVGTVASPYQMNTLVIIDTLVATNVYAEYTAYFTPTSGYNGMHEYVVFMHGASTTDQVLSLDNIEFSQIPLCDLPKNLLSTNITATTADIAWGTILGTSFRLEYGPAGFVPGSSQSLVIDPATSPTTLTGLAPNTNYDVYVSDSCNALAFTGPHSFKTNCASILNGIYTVGGTSGPTNFPTLDSVFDALKDCGISGPVTFNLQGGTFLMANITIENIDGTSPTNTITFNGSGPISDTIKFGSTSGAGFDFSGAAYITFQNLTIYGENSTNLIWLHNDAHHLTWDNCELVASLNTTSNSACVVGARNIRNTQASGANNANHITITNCKIRGGYYGIAVYGTSQNSYVTNFNISNNLFEAQYYYGISMTYVIHLTIDGNIISNFRNYLSIGVYAERISGLLLRQNKISMPTFSNNRGIYISYLNNSSNWSISEISNNFSIAGLHAIYIDNFFRVNIWHNSFSANSIAFYAHIPGSNVDIRNNIFDSQAGYAFYSQTNPSTGYTLNYNIYHQALNGPIAYMNGNPYASLAAWKTAHSSYNTNSLQGDPGFVSSSDLHIMGTLPNGNGFNGLSAIDIDGDSRPLPTSVAVDIGADEYTTIQNDVSLLEIIEPLNQTCGDSNMVVKVVFMNLGSQPATNVSATINITGAASSNISATYAGSLPSYAIDTITVSSFNGAAGGSFTFNVSLNMVGDQDATNNAMAKTIQINDVLSRVPVADLDTICAGGFNTLYYPSNTTRMNFLWLTTLGDTIGTADSLAVGPIGANDTTFILRPIPALATVGPLDNTIGLMANNTAMNHFMNFTVNMATTIYAVDVFATNAGLVDVVIQDAATFATLYTHTVSVSSAGLNTIVLNIPLLAGNYRMGGTTTNNAGGLQCNFTGAQYPYIAIDNSVSITGNTNGPSYYYFFYNWQLKSINCSRPDGEITIINRGSVVSSFGMTINPPSQIGLDVDFNASASANATTFLWDFGDGGTNTGALATHKYLQNGIYTVTLIVNGICGSDTLTQQITIAGISIAESLLSQTLNIYPNPNNGYFNVAFQVEGKKDLQILIVNTLGQTLFQQKSEITSGDFREELDLSAYPAAVYFIQLITEDGTVSRKIEVTK